MYCLSALASNKSANVINSFVAAAAAAVNKSDIVDITMSNVINNNPTSSIMANIAAATKTRSATANGAARANIVTVTAACDSIKPKVFVLGDVKLARLKYPQYQVVDFSSSLTCRVYIKSI